MRLIDADLLEDYIRGNIPLNLQEKFILAVENQPTTYDVKQVIKEVKESYGSCNENCKYLISYECNSANCQIKEIIDIIKDRGI